MTAFVLTTSGSIAPVVALMFMFAVMLVFAPQPVIRSKRAIATAALLLVLVGVGYAVYAEDFVCNTCERCKVLSPGDWEYWLLGCWQF